MDETTNRSWYYVINNAQSGPVGAQEITALIQSGRITRDTLVWSEGMATWLPAGQTELAPQFAQVPPPMARPPQANNGAEGQAASIGACLSEAFGLIKKYPGPFLLGNIVFMIISSFTGGLLIGNWYAGVMLMVRKARAGEPVEFGDIFKGFDRFGLVLGAGLIFSFAVGLGMLFFIIPGLLAGAYLLYVVPLVALEEMSIGDAIKASGKMVEGHLWNHALFLFVISLVGLSGVILCYVGVFVTAPLIPIAIGLAFENNRRASGEIRP
ncbi:MAG: DUF4339 domain-containing protein [Desulfarculus sp.]|nr:DUF4339 domain-containing protein [Desulfarculus sp.]